MGGPPPQTAPEAISIPALPEVSAKESHSMAALVVGMVVWGFLLLVVYLVPAAWEKSLEVMDVALWPAISAVGRWWGVVVLSVGTAVATMACQWLCTDVKLLRGVKKQLVALRVQWSDAPEGSELDKQIGRVMHRGEWRIARAAFVPLGLLLGPVMLSFMWFPERVDPGRINPPPGSTVRVSAGIDGEYTGELAVRVQGASLEESVAPSKVQVVSVRRTLEELRHELMVVESGGLPSPNVVQHLRANGKTAQGARESLEAFLAKPVPPQIIQWSLTAAPEEARTLEFELNAGEQGRGSMLLATGDALPPRMKQPAGGGELVLVEKGRGVIGDVRMTYADTRLPEQRFFWRPLAWAGVNWDAGWLGLYMVSYLPAMFLAKRLFRLP